MSGGRSGIYASCILGWDIRYLVFERVDGRSEFLNPSAMHLLAGSTRYLAVSGETNPPYYSYETWQFVNDENDATIAHTAASPNAYVLLDFGVPRRSRCVRLRHRPSFPSRVQGTRFRALDANRNVVLSYTTQAGTEMEVNFYFPDTTPVVT